MEKKDWYWLDDLEHLVKIILPVAVLLIGIFGGDHFNLSPEQRNELIFAGSLATGLTQGSKRR